jgi:hypothetical protein
MQYEVLKMQTELGNPIQYYLVLKIVFKCESIIG